MLRARCPWLYSALRKSLASYSSSSAAIEVMKQRLGNFETEAGRINGLNFKPDPTDIIITTSPKAGTTWMQQIVHQLRTGGDMDFDEVSEVVPWLELALDQGQTLEGSQRGTPRAFKTHAWKDHCPTGAKYIVIVRDPVDVALSFYKFFEGWFFQPGEIALEPFVREFWLARGVPSDRMSNASYYDHFLSWWPHRDSDDVLFLFFEDMKRDLPSTVARVATFMGTAASDRESKALQAAIQMSSFKFMKEHASRFDEKLSKLARNEAMGLPANAGFDGSKIREGSSGGGRGELTPALVADLDARWMADMEPSTGYSSYAALYSTHGLVPGGMA